MGGHAFPHLHCPRMPPDRYFKFRQQTATTLRRLFRHVVVPTELPSKEDYGDIDFLVASPTHAPPGDAFDWQTMVTKSKLALQTPHGRRGHRNPSVIFCAIPVCDFDNELWIQVDIKVCEKVEMFDWMRFQLNYASALKLVGSMIKPLGLNINPDGLHIRVEEIERTDMPGSMVFLTKEPKDVLKIVGLDRRILNAEFKTNKELYEYFASCWLFNPAHFGERLKSEKYIDHLEDRSAPWVHFVTTWIPEYYPGYRFPAPDSMTDETSSTDTIDLQIWYHDTRNLVREKAFTTIPSASPYYYQKLQTHLKEVEEHRLRHLLMGVLPSNAAGWSDNIPKPRIIIKPSTPSSPLLSPHDPFNHLVLTIPSDILTAPPSPTEGAKNIFDIPSSPTSHSSTDSTFEIFTKTAPEDTPLIIETLIKTPPTGTECTPRLPSDSMSLEARLLCLSRWTLFHPSTGHPYLTQEPREKKFTMNWAEAEVEDGVLVEWAREMWWPIWVRQCHVNYVGMWKRKFEKDEAKEAKKRKEVEDGRLSAEKAEVEKEMDMKREQEKRKEGYEAEKDMEKIMKRLSTLNQTFSLSMSKSTSGKKRAWEDEIAVDEDMRIMVEDDIKKMVEEHKFEVIRVKMDADIRAMKEEDNRVKIEATNVKEGEEQHEAKLVKRETEERQKGGENEMRREKRVERFGAARL